MPRPRSLGDLWIGIGEARCKSPASGGSFGGTRWRWLNFRLRLSGEMTLLQALFVPEQALLCLKQALLGALLPRALRMLRLQLLHALLQAIDAVLALHALAREHIALPVLRGLLGLLSTLLTLELPLLGLLQPIVPLLTLHALA